MVRQQNLQMNYANMKKKSWRSLAIAATARKIISMRRARRENQGTDFQRERALSFCPHIDMQGGRKLRDNDGF